MILAYSSYWGDRRRESSAIGVGRFHRLGYGAKVETLEIIEDNLY